MNFTKHYVIFLIFVLLILITSALSLAQPYTTIFITNPVNGEIVSGYIEISADVTSNADIIGVQFRINNENFGLEDTTFPYSVTWDTTFVNDGVYALKAVARYKNGNKATSNEVMVAVVNYCHVPQPPFTQLDVTPTSINFGEQVVSTESFPQIVTLTNIGTAQLVIDSIDVTGEFNQSNTCGPLEPYEICTMSVTFKPAGISTSDGTLAISSNAEGSPHFVSLSGTGILQTEPPEPPQPPPEPHGELQRVIVFTEIGEQIIFGTGQTPIVSGEVNVALTNYIPNTYEEPKANEGVHFQVTLDDKAISPILNNFPSTIKLDSKKVNDGAHVLSVQIINNNGSYPYVAFPLVILVDNIAGPVSGQQKLPVCPGWPVVFTGEIEAMPCDWVIYSGELPVLQGHPQPVQKGIPFQTILEPSELYGENIMPTTMLWASNNRLFRIAGDHIVAIPFGPSGADTYRPSSDFVDRMPLLDGPRNIGYVTAYITGSVHPITEAFIFAEQGRLWGRVGKIDLDGTITTIAGFRVKPDVLPYYAHDDTIPLSKRATTFEKVGNFVDGPKRFSMPMDVVIDPRDPNILYVADALNHRIAKVDMSTNPATVSTYAGSLNATSGFQDGFATEALFNEPLSLAIAPDGTIYVADRINSVIRKIDPERHVTTLVGKGPLAPSIPPEDELLANTKEKNRQLYMVNGDFNKASIVYPMVIRLDSQGNIIMGEELLGTIRRVNVATGNVELIVATGNVELITIPTASSWVWLDVDREGTFGPKDDIIYITVTSSEMLWRISADGSRVDLYFYGGVVDFEGRMDIRRVGHYGWLVAVGKGALWTNGFGTEGLIRIRKALPQDKVDTWEDISEHYGRGELIYRTGTVPDFPSGSRPAFSLLHGFYGWNQLGISSNFDDLSGISDEELAELIQLGWGSDVKRPEITGKDMRDLIYFIRRNSLPSIRTNVTPGHNPVDNIPPQISNLDVKKIKPDIIKISWKTNEPALGLVQFGSSVKYSRWSEIEDSYKKNHVVAIEGPFIGNALHFGVIAKDEAGNQARTQDTTIKLDEEGINQ